MTIMTTKTTTPRNLLLLIAAVAAGVAVIIQSAAAASANNEASSNTNVLHHHRQQSPNSRRHSAPSRPIDAPDIDYGGFHPFDRYRHLYDPRYKGSRKAERWGQKQQQPPHDLNSRRQNMMRWLKREDANKNGKMSEKEDPAIVSRERKLQSPDNTDNPEATTATTTTLDPTTDSLYQPLRINFDVRSLIKEMESARSSGNTIIMTKLQLLIYEVLPMTAQVWGDILRVIPVTGGIYPLAARGSSAEAWLPNGESNEEDASTGDGNDTAGKLSVLYEDPVRAFYCPDEATSGISGGADLLIYATINRHCGDRDSTIGTTNRRMQEAGGQGGTLASALACQRDQYDRPVTGSIDFCLNSMAGIDSISITDLDAEIDKKEAQGFGPASNENGENVIVGSNGASMMWDGWFGPTDEGALGGNSVVVQYAAGVAIHEIGHVLGISADSLSFFRHPLTGYPLTPRPFTLSMVTCLNGEETPIVGKPSATVMGEGVDKGTGKKYFEVITPTVQRVVRNHFNCPTAMGARLENQPTSSGDCFGSHFEERHFFTDIMGAIFSPATNVLSPLVLAYLEDSGWYRANYQSKYVHIGVFGHGAGCVFLEENCIDSNGDVPEAMEGNFCNTIDASSGSQKCDPSHMQKTYCDWVDVNSLIGIGKTGEYMDPAPEYFQYVKDNPNLRPYSFTNADYCPIAHLNGYNCLTDGGRATQEQLNAGEYYGSDSRCVETDDSRSYSLCLQTKCNTELGKVQLIAGGQTRTCEFDSQVHTILYNYDSSEQQPVRIKCPKAALICPELFCPANCAGRGDCVYTANGRPLAQCVCDSEDDTTGGCFTTPMHLPISYGPALAYPNRANKAVFLAIVGSLVAGLAILFIAVRQWKARQNVFM